VRSDAAWHFTDLSAELRKRDLPWEQDALRAYVQSLGKSSSV
jgi:hypothetical protein